MTLLNIDLAHLRPDPENARHITDGDVDDLVRSMNDRGQLQPILVRSDTADADASPYWLVVAGNRRVEAARKLGWGKINALELDDGSDPLAASAAENMARKAMHPVDTWRAMSSLVDGGKTVLGAAEALGIEERFARRLNMLGRLSPDMIEAIAAERQLPPNNYLAPISLAPHDVQDKALTAALKRQGKGTLSWHAIAEDCSRRRIPLARAIFDVESAGVAFEEDLFAEPGSEDQFTTTDVKGFLAAQTKALGVRITESKGRMIGVGIDQYGTPAAPDGFNRIYDQVPKRWKKDDARKVGVAVIRDGYQVGQIAEIMMAPKPKRATQASLDTGKPAGEREPRPPITKTVQATLAGIKGEALREAVASGARSASAKDMLRLLLLTLTADNISIQTSTQQYGRHGLSWVARGLLDADGKPDQVETRELCAMAADVIQHCIRFDHPLTNFGTSGDTAEWLAVTVGAEDFVPRCDTEEVLKGFSHDKLIEIAREQGLTDTGTAKQLRERMVGKIPAWRPLTFGAATPEPEPPDEDDVLQEAAE
jgi:ParB family transcriptional regulator, chromosome partitioning protein